MTRIVYVDDDDDIREIVEISLGRNAEFEVRTAASGREGLEISCKFRPDLLVLDVMMPELDGPATFAEARRIPQLCETPVVFITARTQTHQMEELMALGARGVIPKPFDPITLAKQIDGLLEQDQH